MLGEEAKERPVHLLPVAASHAQAVVAGMSWSTVLTFQARAWQQDRRSYLSHIHTPSPRPL